MARIKWGPKKMDGHVTNAAARRHMKRVHEKRTRQAAKREIRREMR